MHRNPLFNKTHNRRQVLKGGLAILGGVSLAQSGRAQVPPMTLAQTPTDAEYWHLVRAQFAFGEDRVPMNVANLCPSFRAVTERVDELNTDIDRDCSFPNRARFSDLLEQTRVQGSASAIVNRLYAEYGIAAAPTGGVRLCPTIYNTESHVDRAVTALQAMLA